MIGAKILSFDSAELLGMVKDIIVDPDTGKLEGLWLIPVKIPVKRMVLRVIDIQAFKKNIYVRSDGVFALAEDSIKINEILDSGCRYIGSMVKNEVGESFGRCYDISFNSESFLVQKIYSKKIFLFVFTLNNWIFSFNQIINLTEGVIFVEDDTRIKEKQVLIASDVNLITN